MSSLLFRAWSAAKRGDFAQAGQLYRSAGKLEAAVEMFLKAGEMRAASAAEVELGRIFDAAKHLSDAGDRLEAADLLRDNRRYLQAAHLYADLGQLSQAVAMALEADKPLLAAQYFESQEKYYEAGELLASHEEHVGKAMLYFEKALLLFPDTSAMEPDRVESYLLKKRTIARCLERGGEGDRAADLYEEADDLQGAARCHEGAGRYDRALALYRRLGNADKVKALEERVQAAPLDSRAAAAAGGGDAAASARKYLESGEPEKAAPLFEDAGQLREAAEAWRAVGEWEQAGNAFYRGGDYRDAAECFRQVQLYSLALSSYEKAGDGAWACRMAFEAGMWERAYELAQDPRDREALVKQWQAVPEGTPERGRARLLLGRAFMDLGHPDLALECVRDLPSSVSGETPWLDYIQARCNQAMGRSKEASGFYRRVLARDVDFQDARSRLREVEAPVDAPKAASGGRFRPSREIERGAGGVWFAGEDGSLGGRVLLFRPSSEALDPGRLGEVRNALRTVLDLRHTTVLGLRDMEEGNDGPTLVYEPFEGEALPKAWEAAGGFRPFECLEQFRQVLQALKECHARNLLHGRLEAGCILVGKGGDVKVRGFGLGWLKGDSWRAYASPESAAGGPGSPLSDLYAAGAVLLSALTGSFPPPDSFREGLGKVMEGSVPPDFPARARALLARVLAREPQRRFASADEVLAELDALELPPGAVIAERYEILEELGRGGMGQVFKVRDLQLDEEVALKTLRSKAGMTDAAKARFMREIKLTRKVTHPNVIRVFDMGQFRDLTFLTMEYIPGQTLSAWVRQGPGRASSLGEKVRILTGIASGLAEAHRQGIIHRDLKPQNVILTPQGVPKLLDFGIAYVEEGAELTQEGHFVGSPKYVSPEQVQGKTPDARSDIYCFGLLCYFLMVGDDAFAGDNSAFILMRQIREMPPAPSKVVRVPPSLDRLVMSCLAKQPEERPETIRDVLQSLRAMS